MSAFEDTAFSTWANSLDQNTASELDLYLAPIYSDWSFAYDLTATSFDESGYFPTELAITISTEGGAWVAMIANEQLAGIEAMTAEDFAVWEASPAAITDP